MQLKDLTDDERVALVALIELMVQSNQHAGDLEARLVADDAAELGRAAYRKAAEEADRRFPNENDLRAFLTTIDRQDARELIYATVLDAALADGPDPNEVKTLDWLASLWKVKTQFEKPE